MNGSAFRSSYASYLILLDYTKEDYGAIPNEESVCTDVYTDELNVWINDRGTQVGAR